MDVSQRAASPGAFASARSQPALRHAYYVLVFAVLVPGAHLALGVLLDGHLGPLLELSPTAARWLGWGLGVPGVAMIGSATALLSAKGRGLPLSSAAPTELVVAGPYRIARHPIYVGAVLAFAGLSCWLHSTWSALCGSAVLMFFYACYAAGIEEPVLEARYGAAYRAYRSKTPLLLPFPFRRTLARAWLWVLRSLSRRANAPGLIWFGPHGLFWGYGMWPGIGVFAGTAIAQGLLLGTGMAPRYVGLSICALTLAALCGTRVSWRAAAAIHDRSSFGHTRARIGFVSWGVLAAFLVVVPVLAAARAGLRPRDLRGVQLPPR